MKIICDAPGQTCNRLWSYVATISECIVKKKKMMILFYDYTIEDLPNFKNCSFIYFPLYQKWYLNRRNGWNKFKGLTWKATHNKKLDKIYYFFGCFKGWNTRTKIEYIPEAKKEIMRIFTPRQSIVQEAEQLINKIKKDADIVIGLHIRRGDYKTWNNGHFYYSMEEYRKFMIKIQDEYAPLKISFFISTNENIDNYSFPNCNFYFHQKTSSPILDLYTLSLCDKIIGPFSTFSRWASFIGEKPLCFIESKEQEFKENDFSIIIDYFHFANGKTILNW